jgi:hypothetical protein
MGRPQLGFPRFLGRGFGIVINLQMILQLGGMCRWLGV